MCTYTLVNAVSACLRLRDSEALQQTAINIARTLVPDLAEDILHRVKSLPSTASLSRSRPVVDVGLMLWQKHLNMHLDLAMSHGQEDGFLCRCLLTDSSPQRKFDWLLTEYHTFSGKRFLQLLALAWDMACLRETAAAAGTELEASPQWCQLQTDVEGMLQEKVLEEPWSPCLVDKHLCLPVALGSRRSSLIHKIHALMHALLLEVSLFSGLRKFLESVRAITTDFGVESGIAEARNIRVYELFPYLVDLDFDLADEDAENADDLQFLPGRDSLTFMFEHALPVPGALHVLHGATEELTAGFQHFESWFLPLLRAVVNSLSRPDVQDRLIHSCLRGTGAESFAQEVKQFNCSLSHWRWGTLAQACLALRNLQDPLGYWDISKVNCGQSRRQETADDAVQGESDLRSVGDAVHSPSFWGYLKMLLMSSQVLDHIEHWFEGCACHYVSKGVQEGNQTFFRTRSPCFMSGRRAPELAAGALGTLISKHVDSAKSRLALVLGGLPEEASQFILQDWSTSSARLSAFLQLKFRFWSVLPHKLVGIGHHSEAVSRSIISECVRWFDANVCEEEYDSQHRLVVMYFRQGPLRDQLNQFVEGASRASLPLVAREAASMAMIMTVERSIEGRHALAGSKTKLMKKLSPASFSLSLRAAELQSRCLSTKDGLDHLIQKVSEARACDNLLSLTGSGAHPWAQHIREAGLKLKLAEQCKIIYHCDLCTMMASRSGPDSHLCGPFLPPPKGLQRVAKDGVQASEIRCRQAVRRFEACNVGTLSGFLCRRHVFHMFRF